jgi:site-specific recombinase XerD
MPLEAYKRRHSRECLEAIARRVNGGELQQYPDLEQYKFCRCAWWVRGTNDHGKVVPRQSLKAYTWEAAVLAMKKLNRPETDGKPGKPIAEAAEQWLAQKKNTGRVAPTISAYNLAVRKLIEFIGEGKLLTDIAPEVLDRMLASWTMQASTKNTYRTHLSTFFNYCVRMDWLAGNPMKKTEPAGEGEVHPAEDDELDTATLPLDEEGDENYLKICASIIPFLRNELPRQKERKRERRGIFLRHPENCLALCHLMYETGLRVSDATFFDPSKMTVDEHGGVYTTRQIKNRRHGAKAVVTVYLDPWLVEEIQVLPKLYGRFPFYDGSTNWRAFINNTIRPVLAELGKVIGMKETLRPHRFRDSFAVNRLNEGMTMDELRILLGHANVAMTERYYAPFVKSRGIALRSRYRATKQAHQSGKVVAINKAG